MKRKSSFAICLLILCVGLSLWSVRLKAAPDSDKQNWTNYARIGAYGLKGGDAQEIVRRAQESDVAGIEVDNDIPGDMRASSIRQRS